MCHVNHNLVVTRKVESSRACGSSPGLAAPACQVPMAGALAGVGLVGWDGGLAGDGPR
jgi:hypothetical protein